MISQWDTARSTLSHSVAATARGGWEMSGISVFQSGRAILITAPDNTGNFDFGYTNGSANLLCNPVLSSGQTQNH